MQTAFAIRIGGAIIEMMKTNTIIHGFRKSTLFATCAICALLTAGIVQGKPDKGKSGKDGGKPGHSQKQKGGEKPEDKGKPDKGGNTAKKAAKDSNHADKADKENAKWRKKSFREADRTGVVRYFSDYRDNERGLPPGLAKNYLRGKPLPPGWQKKVYGGYVIDDDLRDYFHPLEYSLFPSLEAVPDTRLYLYGNRIVRVYEPRREVIDLIEVPTIRLD